MKMNPNLSICITAYNQEEIIRENILNLLSYENKDIEIVIQDDCSTDDIEGLVREIDDSRLVYYCNNTNLGHDRNILEGIKNCSSQYVFLLRSSDTIIPNEINTITQFIRDHPNVGYCRFSCVDDEGKIRIKQEDVIGKKGKESVDLDYGLLSHPSGELYNKTYLENEYGVFVRYLDKYFDHKKIFIIDMLMRQRLIIDAGIATSSKIVWRYTYSNKRKDVAQNKSDNGISIYHPQYQYQRYNCELSYAVNELSGEGRKELIEEIINRYARQIVFLYKYINTDREMQKHYAYKASKYSSLAELNRFKLKTEEYAKQYDSSDCAIVIQCLSSINIRRLLCWKSKRVYTSINAKIGKILAR